MAIIRINEVEIKKLGDCCLENRSCINTRQFPEGYTKRRCMCSKCGKRWTTVEIILGDIPYGDDVIGKLESLLTRVSNERQKTTIKLIELLLAERQ